MHPEKNQWFEEGNLCCNTEDDPFGRLGDKL